MVERNYGILKHRNQKFHFFVKELDNKSFKFAHFQKEEGW